MSPHQGLAVAVPIFAVWQGVYVLRSPVSFAFFRHMVRN